jgi:2-methylcitrate dehydratase
MAIADHVVASGPAADERALDDAFLCLLESLACMFESVRDPACARLLGPVVPGATMVRGARVPGTSYELDPVQAAFNLGVMIGWPDPGRDGGESARRPPSCALGALLAVADHQSRIALGEARPAPSARDLLDRLIQAQEIERGLAGCAGFDDARCDGEGLHRCLAATAVVTAMLGGTHAQVVDAVSNAWLDAGARRVAGAAVGSAAHRGRTMGDDASRAVRLACLAMTTVTGQSNVADAPAEVFEAMLRHGPRSTASTAVDAAAIRRRFEAAVLVHFPAVQAGKIMAAFQDSGQLAALPVNKMVALLVRN